jgi:hypothetical protein
MDFNNVLSSLAHYLVENLQHFIQKDHISFKMMQIGALNLGVHMICIKDDCHFLTMIYILKTLLASYPEITPKQLLTKTHSIRDVKDIQLAFESNILYIEIDCEPWTHMERRSIPDLILSLARNAPVLYPKHFIIIRHINLLAAPQLYQIKKIIEKTSSHANYFITTTNCSYVMKHLGSLGIKLCIKFEVSQLLDSYMSHFKLCKTETLSTEIATATVKEFFEIFLRVHGMAPHDITLKTYIYCQLTDAVSMYKKGRISDTYTHISDYVNAIMSSDVPVDTFLTHLLEYSDTKVITDTHQEKFCLMQSVVHLLATSDAIIKQQNKTHFGLEECVFHLVVLISSKSLVKEFSSLDIG